MLPARRKKVSIHRLLLISLIVLFAFNPVAGEFLEGDLIEHALVFFVLNACLLAVKDNKKVFFAASIFGALAFVFEGMASLRLFPLAVVFAYVSEVPFFLLVTKELLDRVIRAKAVNSDLMVCAVTIYLLLGVIWLLIYQGIEILSPGSFSFSESTASTRADSFSTTVRSQLFYFSFITMTTIGYGDIVPINSIAKSFAVLQGLTGQLFIAVLVARLVALQVLTERAESERSA